MRGIRVGVDVQSHALAKLVECVITETWFSGVICGDHGYAQLAGCTCTGSVGGAGCRMDGEGSAHVTNCPFLKNSSGGLCAVFGQVTAFRCVSESNKNKGFSCVEAVVL